MVKSTSFYEKSGKFLVVLYLLLFPFGQLLRFSGDKNYGNLQDLIVLSSLPIYLLPFTLYPKIDKFVRHFFYVSLFSLFLSLNYYSFSEVIYGSLYLIRITSYYSFGILVYNLVRLKVFQIVTLINYLITVSVISAFFGWTQYFLIPDLVFLKYMNWDDHLYRLVGTFIDPGFTGIVFIFGALLSIYRFRHSGKRLFLFLFIFLTISTIFTYSRASYLSFIVGLSLMVCFERKLRKIAAITIVVFLLSLFLIPKTEGEGVKLLRTASISARFTNYSQTLEIVKKHPLFGVGLNNLCAVRTKMFGERMASHSCSGVDSSILFILATTGMVGLMIITFMTYRSVYFVDLKFRSVLVAFYGSLFAHSLFAQSAFYSFVMGFLAVFFGVLKESRENR